jgi:hypothetical protein
MNVKMVFKQKKHALANSSINHNFNHKVNNRSTCIYTVVGIDEKEELF